MYSDRYVYDALYGSVHYPEYLWKVLLCPEVQRLREVRLCNINSLCLTGGANINRYEHSLGTAYLALKCVEAWPHKISEREKQRIVLAALLHDLGTTAFGHSVQYVLDTKGYVHESVYDIITQDGEVRDGKYNYQLARMEPIYFGMPKRLAHLIPSDDLKAINDMVNGLGPYYPLINGTVDLDNLDNVYRLAYHIGLIRSGDTPLELARSVWVEKGKLVIEDAVSSKLEEWYEVRRTLYRYLLLNPDEFSAKCMLEEALFLAQARPSMSFSWHDVDYQLLEKLSNCSYDVSSIISRLMLGDLYGCIGIYSTSNIAAYEMFTDPETRSSIEKSIEGRIRKLSHTSFKSAIITIHAIKDVNKTQRQVKALTSKGKTLVIGEPSREVLMGVFFKNAHLSMTLIRQELLEEWGVSKVVQKVLRDVVKDTSIKELTPYGEANSTNNEAVATHRS
jgi:uncharacterized protein